MSEVFTTMLCGKCGYTNCDGGSGCPSRFLPTKMGFFGANPVPAAPSLDAVPVGSRWRWKERFMTGAGRPVRVGAEVTIRPGGGGAYDTGVDSDATREEILAHATRIDEPAGAGKLTSPHVEKHADGSYTVTLPNGAKMFFRDREAMDNGTATDPPRPPAMPPAGCAPGCVPAKPCRITIPVTDTGTRYECPAFAEDRTRLALTKRQVATQHERTTFIEVPVAPRETADQAEARSMRDQRWEPAPNGLGAFPGRYRFDRRPR